MATLVLLAAGAYLFGAIPTANILAWLFRRADLREFGSGAVTSSNAGQLMGKWAVSTAGVLDILKGAAPVWVAQALDRSLADQMVLAATAVAGHNWSPFLGFQGGRGLTVVIGALLATASWVMVLFADFVLLGLILFRNVPIVLGLGIALLPLWAYSLEEDPPLVWGLCVLALLILAKRMTGNRFMLPARDRGRVLLYRFLYDRDTRDREAWVRPHEPEEGVH